MKRSLKPLQTQQNRALKICLRAPKTAHTDEIHRLTQCGKLEDGRNAHLLNFMYVRKADQVRDTPAQRNTRLFDAPVLNVVKTNKSAGDRSVFVKGAQAWNVLPAGVRNLPSHHTFQEYQKKMVINKIRAQPAP